MSLFSSDKTTFEDGHINVLGEFHAKPEFVEQVKEMLTALVEPTRGEDGCKDYHLLQNSTDSAHFVTYESWTGEDKLQKHLAGVQGKLDAAKHMLVSNEILTFNHAK